MAQVAEAKGEFRGTTVRDDPTLAAWLAKHSEPALEPDLPIIDPHHHFWDSPHRGHYLLPELLADIGGGQVSLVLSFMPRLPATTARRSWRPAEG
jgi:hypothetical protein